MIYTSSVVSEGRSSRTIGNATSTSRIEKFIQVKKFVYVGPLLPELPDISTAIQTVGQRLRS